MKTTLVLLTLAIISVHSSDLKSDIQNNDGNKVAKGEDDILPGIPRSNDEPNNVNTAVDLLQDIYNECVQNGSFLCVKPKVLAFLSSSMSRDKIRVTRDLTIVRTTPDDEETEKSFKNEVGDFSNLDLDKKESLKLLALDKLDEFLSNHELRIRVPKEISAGHLPPFVPPVLSKNLPQEIKMPLSGGYDGDQFTARGKSKKFMKRVVMPFLLGLKFKATTIVPLAFALIALKTWKAFTLALLSIVLSAAMVVFKFTSKPKVSYEVVHYPQPVPVYPDHSHHEYVPHAAHHEYVPHSAHHEYAHGRELSSHHLAYAGQISERK